MINNKTILAIIPSRSGSKGIKNKNIKKLNGIPLLSRTIREVKESLFIDEVVVSTDSNKIASLAISENINVPFIRPKAISKDNSTSQDVILHTLKWFKSNKNTFDLFIYLQPTSPFRTRFHIDESLKLFVENNDADSLVSVKAVSEHPLWMKTIRKSGLISNYINSEKVASSRQGLPEVFLLNGAIYISNCKSFMRYKSFYERNCLSYIMDNHSSLDIDTHEDWKYAEYLELNSSDN